MYNNKGISDCRELLVKVVSKMGESTFSVMKQSNLKTEIKWGEVRDSSQSFLSDTPSDIFRMEWRYNRTGL